MTAPSMAEVLGRHLPGDYTHLFDADPASTPPERTVRCRCGDRGGSTFAEHVAQALADAGFGHVASVERERDAYRRAKQENDERFQIEAQEQRARAQAAEAQVAAVRALADEWGRTTVGEDVPGGAFAMWQALRAVLDGEGGR